MSKDLRFAALNPYGETSVVSSEAKRQSGKDWFAWGDGNHYPDYLLELYSECTTLHSIIGGFTDYVAGDGAEVLGREALNKRGDTADDIVRALAFSYAVYGGFALQVIRNAVGEVAEVYSIQPRFIRTNEDNTVFWYSEQWGRQGRVKVIEYPKFMRISAEPSSIFFWKDADFQVYPSPVYAASVKAAEVERSIDTYHLNNINNGFMGSYIVNFNNGIPAEDAIKDEIERDFNEKFSGKENAGRIMLAWNNDKEHAVTLQKMEVSDYGEKYDTLSKHCRQQLFTAFRANPNLFGIPTEDKGFSNEEYTESFNLFNRTRIVPVQRAIVGAFEKIGWPLTIYPFTIEGQRREVTE